jgi:hypothetical protein
MKRRTRSTPRLRQPPALVGPLLIGSFEAFGWAIFNMGVGQLDGLYQTFRAAVGAPPNATQTSAVLPNHEATSRA